MSNATAITDATFADEVLLATQPVVVDYWAEWCSPCKQLSPIIDELAEKYAGTVKFVKIDTDANMETASTQGIQALPTLQFFVGGRVVQSVVGAKPKSALVKILDELV
ncbi:MAG: thioredoxin [Propionibacteriaceae bacterium]|jgi:thioredoxin 1|nr:thioredoxin [Propionibacteriaceae bacterium]